MQKIAVTLSALALAGCLTVRESDLIAWQGQPVELLDTQPFFLTVPVVRTRTESGIEIRNYVNGQNIASCTQGGTVFAGYLAMASFSSFNNCTSRFAACNNLFYIQNGRVIRYEPISSGGAICITDDRVLPRKMI